MSNIINIADIHFGKNDDKKLYDELMEGFIKPIQEKIADGKIPDLININGDLYHRVLKFNEEGARLVLYFIEEVLLPICIENNIQLRIIRGTKSHDFNQLSMLKKLEVKTSLFKIHETACVEEIAMHNTEGDKVLKVLYIPEEYPGDFKEFYDKFLDVEENTYDAINGHGMMSFVSFTGYDSAYESEMKSAPVFDENKLIKISKGPVIFGHVHDYHNHEDQVYYCSSFTRYGFGEKEKKGWLDTFINVDDATDYSVDFIQNELAPTYITINLDKQEFEDVQEKVDFINEMKAEYDHIRLISSDDNNIKIIKKISENNPDIKVKLKNKKKDEVTMDTQFMFLLEDNDNSVEEDVQQYINITKDKTLSLDIIGKLLSDDDIEPSEIVTIIEKQKEETSTE